MCANKGAQRDKVRTKIRRGVADDFRIFIDFKK